MIWLIYLVIKIQSI